MTLTQVHENAMKAAGEAMLQSLRDGDDCEAAEFVYGMTYDRYVDLLTKE